MNVSRLKILVLSDFHGAESSLEKASKRAIAEKVDAITLSGDLTHFGDVSDAQRMLRVLSRPRIPVVFVPGNCDPLELVTNRSIEGTYCLHGTSKTLSNLSFLGIGGSLPGPFDTPLEVEEEAFAHLLDRAYEKMANKNRFILISHTPPKNTKVDATRSGAHIGSAAIRDFIVRAKPLAVVCGHVHEARGTDKVNEALVVNPGPAKLGMCALLEVSRGVKVELSVL